LGIIWDLMSRQLADQPTGWLGIWDFSTEGGIPHASLD
jgi:hypothetical protein